MKEPPPVAVWVDETVRIHETKVLRLVVGRASRGYGLCDEIVYLLAALATKAEQGFHCLARIANSLGSEFAKLGMGRQHDGNRLGNDDHRVRVAGELRVVAETKRLEKGRRLWQIGDGQVEAYLFDHRMWRCGHYFNE